MDSQLVQQVNDLHGDHHAGAVVDCSCAEVPGVEVARDNDYLLRVLSSLPVGDDVVAFCVGQRLRAEREVELDWALTGQVFEQVGVLGCDGSRWDLGDTGGVLSEAGMWKPVVRTANGAHQYSRRAHRCAGDGSSAAVDHPAAVRLQPTTLTGEFLVELVVEEQNLALNGAWRQK